jgi:hypothetical protein
MFQYLANVDEAPASQGGKENYWRKLTLDGKSSFTHTSQLYLDATECYWENAVLLFLQE